MTSNQIDRLPFEVDFLQIYNLSLDMIVIMDSDGTFRHVNPKWTEVMGWEPDEVIGKSFEEFIHSDDVLRMYEVGSQLLSEKAHNFTVNNQYRTKSGLYKQLSWNCTNDRKNKIVYSVAKDITEQLSHQSKLELQGERYDLATLGGNIGVFDWDMRQDHMWLSDVMYKIIDKNPEQFVPTIKAFNQITHPDDVARIQQAMEDHIIKGADYILDCRVKVKGKYRWFKTSGQVQLTEIGTPIRLVGTMFDIETNKSLELELENKVKELERINRLMVNREIKMRELKQEIKKLKGK